MVHISEEHRDNQRRQDDSECGIQKLHGADARNSQRGAGENWAMVIRMVHGAPAHSDPERRQGDR